MSFKILDFYKISSPLAGGETDSEDSSTIAKSKNSRPKNKMCH